MREHMKKKEKSSYLIKTVAHALDILEQFHDKDRELGVTELSRQVGLHKHNVFRLLATLESRNYIVQNERTETYRLGLKNLQIGQAVVKQMEIHRQSMPVLKSLTGDCNETCYVAIQKGPEIVYLDSVETTLPVRVVPRIGIMLPVHCTAAGKVLLAGAMDTKPWDWPTSTRLKKYAPNTITDSHHFRKQLQEIATQGYALEDEELDIGVRGVAAPVRDYSGGITAAIGIAVPSMRVSEARMLDELVPMVKRAAEELSSKIGYRSSPYR